MRLKGFKGVNGLEGFKAFKGLKAVQGVQAAQILAWCGRFLWRGCIPPKTTHTDGRVNPRRKQIILARDPKHSAIAPF